MKIFKFLLVTVTSFLFFFSHSALAEHGVDDVPNDTGDKSTIHGAELEVNEFVLLDSMPNVEMYYYPYTARDANVDASEDVPGGAGSVYVGGGVIKWNSNVNTTISIDDFTFTHTDANVSTLNEVVASDITIHIDDQPTSSATAGDQHVFDYSRGSAVADMSGDMQTAYNQRDNEKTSESFTANNGYTDFATKYYFTVTLADAGSVQSAGTYQASATVRAIPTVSN